MRLARPVSRLVQLIMLVIMSNAASAEKLTIERLFAAPDLSGASLRSPHISPDGRFVAYLRGKDSNKDRLDLWAYDIARHEHRLLVDSALLEPQERALSPEEEQRRERQRTSSLSGIVEYEFSANSRYLLVPLGGELYVYDLQAPPAQAVRRLTNGAHDGYETDAHFSPRGSYVSFIRNQNLVVYDLASSTERAITKDGSGLISYGTAEFIAQEEMDRTTGYWWSPDEKRIAFTKVDESPVAEIDRFEIYADSVKVIKQRYPAAGARNAIVQLFVKSTDDDTPAVQVDLGKNTDIYLARVNWLPNSTTLAVQRQSRDQKTLTLLRADVTTGATLELLTEHSDTWVPLHDELTFLDHGKELIWASSRTGFKHLYLYDITGKLIRPLTSGEWEVTGDSDARAIRGIDEHNVYFMANAESPLERHLYSVSVKDARPTPRRITADSGWHDVTMSKDAKVFLDTFSTPDHPPSLTLRAADGKTLAPLVPNDVTPDHPYAPYLSDHLPTEFGTLKASDGQTLYYQIIKPKDLDPGKRYPVVVDVYGGPGVQRVRKAWGGYPRSNEGLFREYLAQHGYIVFTLDNRGTAARGVRFSSSLYHHMGSVEVQDQVAGVNFLKTLPYVDPKKIAVFGWSYGGYMALMCLMQAPEAFAAAIAGAPVTDWHLYDTHYTERYMGTPQENAAGYAASSVMTYADKLRGPLLIMHGMADDNVLFTHSTTLFKKLQDLDKQFDIMTYPGSKHGLLRHADTGLHGYATIKRFLDTQLGGDAGH